MHDFTTGAPMILAKSMRRAHQANLVLAAIANKDIGTLRRLAREPNGFVQDSLRRFVWPVLLHTHHGYYVDEKGSAKDITDPTQISKDVDRSLYYYPPGISPKLKAHKQKELHSMIVEVLWRNPSLKYYQGFHDICTVFLLALGKKAAIPAASNVAMFFIRDAMLDSFEPISKQLRLMSSIVEYEDPILTTFLERANVMPYYALSWILTWFSHDIGDFDKITRLFDFFIAGTALTPVYTASAITLLRRTEILQAEPDVLHSLVTRIPPDTDVELVIQTAIRLEERYPPLQLQKQSGIWLHDESAINTWEQDWSCLRWDDVPDCIKAEQYLGNRIPKEEWEDELLDEWMARRQRNTG